MTQATHYDRRVSNRTNDPPEHLSRRAHKGLRGAHHDFPWYCVDPDSRITERTASYQSRLPDEDRPRLQAARSEPLPPGPTIKGRINSS